MPFTFSHPALVLPLLRFKWLSMTGLVVGSLSPDFEYFFIQMQMKGYYSHTVEGALIMDLLMAIIFAILFHQLAKRPLVTHLPAYFQKRLEIFYQFDFVDYLKKNWFIFLVSTIIGIYSHILWDDFTHADGYFVTNFNALQYEIYLSDFTIYIYKILQHSSTIIGGLIILLYFHRSPSSSFLLPKSTFPYWLVLIFIAIIMAVIRLVFLENWVIGHFIALFFTCGLSSLMITGGLYQKLKVKT